MLQRKYFEIYATTGRPAVPDRNHPWEIGALLDDMKYARIHAGAFIHNGARDYSFEYGNNEVLWLSGNTPRLYPLAVVNPTAHIETGNPDYYSELLEHGVRGFVTLPKSPLRSLMTPKVMEKIASALILHKRPLIVEDVNDDNLFKNIVGLANAYPELPIIMQGVSWGINRLFMEAMGSVSNLYFDISSNHTNSILELTKKHFGIERALYSSSWPFKSMGAMKSMIEYADISDADKDLVAHGNACRLFGIKPDSIQLYDDSQCEFDTIAKEADAGLPLSIPVIDAHSHVVESKNSVNSAYMPNRDAKGITDKMDRMGINSTITAPWIGICYDGIAGNEELISAVKEFPGRFSGYSTCNVNFPDEIAAVKEYHLKYPDIFVGIKPYPPAYKFKLQDESCRPWLEFANEQHLPALIHCEWTDFADQVAQVAPLYPNITFILAHSGANYHVAKYNADLAKKYPNIVLDITYTTTGRGMIEFLVEQVGADRVIFGTDTPMRDAAPQLGWVCYAKISENDKRKILAENIKRIIEQRI